MLALLGCSRGSTNVRSGDSAQVLHRGIGPDLTDLDPQLWIQTSDYTVLSSLLEGLVSEDPIDLHPVPGVAERWESSADGLSYTFHLRADARWSNGEPVTAGDFIASWRRILSPSFATTRADQLFLIRGAEAFNRGSAEFSAVGLQSPDPRTLTVTLDRPAPWFLSVLSGPSWLPVPVATIAKYGSTTERGTNWATPERWVGNGPFVLASWRRGQEIVVAKSPSYWDAAKVRLREIHFHAFDSIDAEERAFRAGQLHVTETVPPSKIDSYRRDSPDLLRTDPLLGTYFVRVNVRRPGLGDERVRLALAVSIDRQAIVEKILRGGQAPAYTFTPAAIAGYAPERVQEGTPEAARLLLSQAAPAGLPELSLLYNNSDVHREVAEAIQEMWRQRLGINVQLVNEDLKSVEEARRSGNYDLLLSSWIADYEDPSAFLDIWRGDSGDNFTGWKNADYDSTLLRAEQATDAAARNRIYQKGREHPPWAGTCDSPLSLHPCLPHSAVREGLAPDASRPSSLQGCLA